MSCEKDECSPIHYAIQVGSEKLLECFLGSYAKKNPKSNRGRTALHDAAMKGSLSMVKKLCQHLDDRNPTDIYGYTPLHLASAKGHLEIVNYLLEKVDDANLPTNSETDNQTPLHIATKFNHLDVIKSLVKLNKNINIETKSGKTAYDLACDRDYDEAAGFLLMFQEWNLLHYAARDGSIDIVKFNSSYPYKNTYQQEIGYSPLHVAVEFGRLDVVKFLANHFNVTKPITSSSTTDLLKEPVLAGVGVVQRKCSEASQHSLISTPDQSNEESQMRSGLEDLIQDIKSGDYKFNCFLYSSNIYNLYIPYILANIGLMRGITSFYLFSNFLQ